MISARRLVVAAIILAGSISLVGQVQPNLENGFKAEVKASEITSRELQLAVPARSVTDAQRAVIDSATTRAQKMGVKLTVTEVK